MRRAAVIALLALAASACTIDVDIGIALDRSGSGSVTVAIEADQEFHDLFELTGRDFEDLVATRDRKSASCSPSRAARPADTRPGPTPYPPARSKASLRDLPPASARSQSWPARRVWR